MDSDYVNRFINKLSIITYKFFDLIKPVINYIENILHTNVSAVSAEEYLIEWIN